MLKTLTNIQILTVASTLLTVSGFPARAQSPGAANPGLQLREELRRAEPTTPQYQPSEELLPESDTSPNSTESSINSRTVDTFFLKAIRIQGNNTLSDEKLIQPFIPIIGTDITLDELKAVALDAESQYKRAGFITTRVFIPQQSLRTGNVIVKVVEGFIEKLDLRGGTDGLRQYVRKMLQPVANSSEKIFNFKTLERQLLLIRNFDGVNFKTSLSRGTKLGGSLLTVDLTTNYLNGGINVNNNISPNLGDAQASLNLQSVVPTSQPIKVLASGSYAWPYDNGLISGLASFRSPIGNKGFEFDGLYSFSSTKSTDLYDGVGKLQTGGESNYWSAGISYPLILNRNSKLSVALRGSGQNSFNDLFLDDSNISNLTTDKIRAARLSIDGYIASERSVSSLGFKFSQGLGGFDSDLTSGQFPSNPNASKTFTSARLDLARTQKLFDFGTILSLKAAGQMAFNSLPVPEAFSYGGPNYGRAFNSAYILGDQGWAGSMEISQNIIYNIFENKLSVAPFIWIDYGSTQNKEDILPDQTASTYGIGIRGNALFNTTFEAGFGYPLSNSLDNNDVGFDNGIVYFTGGWRF